VKSLRALLGSRLAVTIYLVGLAQVAVVAAGFFALLWLERAPFEERREERLRYLALALEHVAGDPDAMRSELARAREDFRIPARVFDPDGVEIVAAGPGRRGFERPLFHGPDGLPPRPPPGIDPPGAGFGPGAERPRMVPPHDGMPPRGPPPRDMAPGDGPPRRSETLVAPLRFPDGREGRLEVEVPARPPLPVRPSIIGFVLLVVGVSSWLLGRALTRPLQQLSGAARAFGGGDLAARAALARQDELGEVGREFDEMAERVTDLLRAEKELLANVSHELRTPLARIRVALDLAAEGDADVAREALRDIAGDLDELERLISDVLAAARLELTTDLAGRPAPRNAGGAGAGIPPLRRARLEPAVLVDQAAQRFRARQPDRQLEVETDAALPPLDGDAVLLRRVLDNLLENAARYSDAGQVVRLEARGGEAVTLVVADQGIGISAEDLPRVFRPFYRADKSRSRATGGLGLGLALVKRIVEAHGGSIELESAPGQGTRARVRLPAATNAEPKSSLG
jgi:two-component system, OmpR family, sensor kinase